MTIAVVLGAGGSAALGWQTGVLAGLADEGVDIPPGVRVVGTSAGALLAGRRCSGATPAELVGLLGDVAALAPPDIDFAVVSSDWARAAAGASSALDARQRIGAAAKRADVQPRRQRRAEIAALLGRSGWPDDDLVVTAVSADTGSFVTFDRESGVDFVDAVGASCAVPSVWPTVEIDGEHFMDGSVLSPTNVPVAAPCQRVLVLAPLLPELGGGIAREVAQLGPGVTVEVISSDEDARVAFGRNPLDPRVTPASAVEGRRQGREAASRALSILG